MPGFVAERAKATHAAAATAAVAVAGLNTGNLLVVALSIGVGGTAPSLPTDNGVGSAWQNDAAVASVAGTQTGLLIATTIIGSTPPTTVNINLANAASSFGYKIAEFSGIAAAAWLDIAGTGTVASGNTVVNGPAITPAVSGDLILGLASVTPSLASYTAGANYTAEGTPIGTAPEPCLIYRLVGTNAETPPITVGSATTTIAAVASSSYKAAAVAPGGPPAGCYIPASAGHGY